jgi:hypothetical protein
LLVEATARPSADLDKMENLRQHVHGQQPIFSLEVGHNCSDSSHRCLLQQWSNACTRLCSLYSIFLNSRFIADGEESR